MPIQIFTLVISGFAGPKLTKFLHSVNGSSLLLICPSTLQYYDPFQNANATNKGGVANFVPKLVAMATLMATPHERLGKEVRSIMYDPMKMW